MMLTDITPLTWNSETWVSRKINTFSRNRCLARKSCVAASSVDLCDVFG